MSERSHVVVRGFEARYYDELLNILSMGAYPVFIEKVVNSTLIEEGEKVVELGVGNGRNAILMLKKASGNAEIVGFDISEDMIKKAVLKTAPYFPQIKIVKQDILKPISGFDAYFDHAFISFVFHGLENSEKDTLLQNLRKILKRHGYFYILDYNQRDIKDVPFYFKFFIKNMECPLAQEYLSYPLNEKLFNIGFHVVKEQFYLKNTIKFSTFRYE